MNRSFNILPALVLTAAASPIEGFVGLRKYTTGARARKHAVGSIATANRWTGHPHEHKRAIARQLKQAARRNVQS